MVSAATRGYHARSSHKCRMFDLWCLQKPSSDTTTFPELVKLVESAVKSESYRSPGRPIYLVGQSFGACLALAVAARNPDIDLILVLANPATSYSGSQLWPLLPMLEAMSKELDVGLGYIQNLMTGAFKSCILRPLTSSIIYIVAGYLLMFLSRTSNMVFSLGLRSEGTKKVLTTLRALVEVMEALSKDIPPDGVGRLIIEEGMKTNHQRARLGVKTLDVGKGPGHMVQQLWDNKEKRVASVIEGIEYIMKKWNLCSVLK